MSKKIVIAMMAGAALLGATSVALASHGKAALPLPFRLLRDFPVLRRLPARLVGMGFRPEHVAASARR